MIIGMRKAAQLTQKGGNPIRMDDVRKANHGKVKVRKQWMKRLG